MDDRIKILYFYHASTIGGGSYCLYNIIDNLDKRRFQPIVLLKSQGPLCDLLEKIGAVVHIEKTISIVPYNRSIINISEIKSLYYLFLSFSKLKKLIIQIQPDLVYINTMMMHPYLIVAKKLKVKTIIHVREHWPRNEHRFQYNLAKNNIEKYADRIVAINKTSASMVNAPQKTTVVYDWIDFTNRDENISFEAIFGKNFQSLKIFTFTGGVDPIKGTMEVVKTFSSEVSDPNARLLILVSDTALNYNGFRGKLARFSTVFNYDTYSNRVKKMIQKDSRIICIPSTYNLKQIIEKSYCILSYFTIPHANLVLAESVYLGQIAIAALTPEALEYSNNGKSARLFNINNINEFAASINELVNKYDHYKRRAAAGMKHNKFLFDRDRNSAVLDDIYNSFFQ